MFKYTKWVLRVMFPLLWAYFSWMMKYARKPEDYPIELRYAKTRKFMFRLAKILGLEMMIQNPREFKNDEKYYYVANHTSLVDAIVTICLIPEPVTFIVKNEARKMPFVRLFIKIIGGVYIERDNLKQEIRAMQQTRTSLANKEVSWMVFPEGTRNRNYHAPIQPYKPGAFKAPLQTGTTIIPLVYWGTQLVLPRKTRAKKYPILVKFLPEVMTSGLQDTTTHDIAEAINKDSNTELIELKSKYKEIVKINKYGMNIINGMPGKEG